MASYYQTNDGEFIGVTDEHPKGFPNMRVGHDGKCEGVWSDQQLARFKPVAIDDVPDHWLQAIGYDERVAITTDTDLMGETYFSNAPASGRDQTAIWGMLFGIILAVVGKMLGIF